jgi:hypothetical protein
MPTIRNLVTGTLNYELKKEFYANSLTFREVEIFSYEIYNIDFTGLSPLTIQKGIESEFLEIYSGDINVQVFNTSNTLQYPSDSIRASRYNVSVEIFKSIQNEILESQHSELDSNYYKGLNSDFWSAYSKYLLDFKENYAFGVNQNGNKEFNHDISFSLRTGVFQNFPQRKDLAQKIAKEIFDKDKETTFGISLLSGDVLNVADASLLRNYYNESYDLFKNSYSFSRKRERLPFENENSLFNINQSIVMSENGVIEITEKGSNLGKINFISVKNDLENVLSQSYNRSNSLYFKFYNTGIILQDPQYENNLPISFLPLINTPTKIIKNYDANALTANYEVTYTNNPEFSGDGTITSQVIDFAIDPFNKIEANHSFDYTLNKITKPNSYFIDLFNNTTGQSPSTMLNYYQNIYPEIKLIYPNFNLVKISVTFPNIKTKASAKFSYSNNPTYFININGKEFKIFDISIEKKTPSDIISEYKIINRETKNKRSILSYAYQSEKGEIQIKANAKIGKYSKQFYTDGQGDFSLVGSDQIFKLSEYLEAIYKFIGQKFFEHFQNPISTFNWFISDSDYSFDSEGEISVTVNYIYTLKKRNPQ